MATGGESVDVREDDVEEDLVAKKTEFLLCGNILVSNETMCFKQM